MRLVTAWFLVAGLLVGAAAQTKEQESAKPEAELSEAVKEALQLNEQAIKLIGGAKYDEAMPLADRALAMVEKDLGPEHPHIVPLLINLARIFEFKGEYDKAEPLFLRAVALAEKVLKPEHPYFGASLNNLARLYVSKAEYNKAEALFLRAVDVREKALGPKHYDFATSLSDLATFYTRKGEYDKAEQLFLRALGIYEKALEPEHRYISIALNNLAGLYEDKADYNKAETIYLRALEIQEKVLGPEHPYLAAALNNLAAVYRSKGEYSKAATLYFRALAIREKALGARHPSVAISLNNLADLYDISGNRNKAEELYLRTLDIREKALGPEHTDVAVTLNDLATLYRSAGEYKKAEPLYLRALAIREKALGPEHRSVASSLNSLAIFYGLTGEHNKAETFFSRALEIYEKALGSYHPTVGQTLNNAAVFYIGKGNVSHAIDLQLRAGEIDEYNISLIIAGGNEEQKRAYMQVFSGSTDTMVSLHLRYAPNDNRAARLALTTILRRKGRVLDTVVESLQSLRQRLNPGDQMLLNQLNDARSQLATLVFKGPGKTNLDLYKRQIAKLEEDARKLETAVSSRVGEFQVRPQPVTLELAQKSIPEDAALVELVSYNPFYAEASDRSKRWGANHYAAYVLTRQGEPQCIDLGDAAGIDADVSKLLGALRNPNSTDFKQRARTLDETLMRPIRRLLGNTRKLLISPDSQLNKLPFGVLVNEEGKCLIEQFSITYLTSGRDLLRLQARSESRDRPLILASPAFDDASRAMSSTNNSGSRSVDFSGFVYESLPGTAEEAKQLATILPEAKLLIGPQATETAIKQARGPGLLHIATHGFFLADKKQVLAQRPGLGENPLLRSGLALAGFNKRQSGNDDGVLTALEAAGLDLWGTKLVVLSACETGLGDVENGEGVYGLRRAFAMAGAESQVMSLWKVADTATKELMVAYYNRLMRGEGRSEALRQVQLEMMRGKQWQHPYYWAGFIASGEWANLQEKR